MIPDNIATKLTVDEKDFLEEAMKQCPKTPLDKVHYELGTNTVEMALKWTRTSKQKLTPSILRSLASKGLIGVTRYDRAIGGIGFYLSPELVDIALATPAS